MLNGKSVENVDLAPKRDAGEIVCARTYSGDVLREFYLDARVWGPMQCDGAPDADQVDFDELSSARMGFNCIFVKAEYDGVLAGLFMFHMTTTHCYDIHSALLPEFWGRGIAYKLGYGACLWMVENTPCEKITTSVPEFNEAARQMAMMAGMRVEGCNRGSFMKNGTLYDQLLLGFTKEELLCQ
jgi:RimJ/RimL family protein N-acetyltransferase